MSAKQVVVEVPEKVLLAAKMDADEFGAEMRMLTAVKLFELGRLSSGRAAELAGISRCEFLLKLGEYRVFRFAAELEGRKQSMSAAISHMMHSRPAITPYPEFFGTAVFQRRRS